MSDMPKSFEDVWEQKEKDGFRYGADALEQVRFGWRLAEEELTEHYKLGSVYRKQVGELEAQVSELKSQLAKAQKDAGRYRWLRTQPDTSRFVFLDKCNGSQSGKRMDATIDAAIGEGEK